MKYPHCPQCRNEVTWYSIWFNVFMVVYKIIMSLMTNCAALMADAFHSLADLFASILTLFSLKLSAKPANEQYAYGYGKIQHISSGIVGLILLVGSIFIMVDAVMSIVKDTFGETGRLSLVAAVVSTIGNELMFHYQKCVATQNNSPAIMANAWDNRSDAFSSLGMVIGLLFATVLGFPIADPLAAIILSLLVIKIGFELISDAVDNLMDATPEIAESAALYKIISTFPKVLGVNHLRARSMGETVHMEIDIRVDGRLKVFEGDLILVALREKIKQELGSIGELQFFMTPAIEKD